jgi:prephenate dehydrogenase
MDIRELEQETLMYRKLLEIVDIVSVDSKELFLTLETQNPYAKDIRNKFLKIAGDIHK